MRAADRACDAAYGVDTREEKQHGAAAGRTRFADPAVNMPSYYLRLLALRRALRPGPGEVIADLGCGAGRALAVLSGTGARCRGVECDPAALRRARENARRLARAGRRIEIVHVDAAAFAFTDETIVYLFNPFGPDTLRAVLANLRASLRLAPRKVRIAYYYPRHRTALDGQDWLRPAGLLRGLKTDIALWETR